ncbi:hypothetical protein PRIPAC_82192 [Pristionchus pacificus]|uniref:Nuclear receptor n=1 Tax=Pristionchus pacificus TaxID=54126 RepID=A0A2A6C1Z8_PRIPA|nr:hypothetical protein PRIPAC_82192 [Pristionchus pacificus]|eukprot:PDM72156.1 nuclear receptor [Pristionchus pacificus]
MSDSRPCLICTAPSKYAHYGVESCRSCAEFYKRTVTADRSFVCRKGHGKCVINPKDRHNCRGCRFERCKQLGMKLPEELPNIRSTSDQLLPIGIPSRVHARERSKSLELPIGRAAGQQPISPSSTQKVSGCSCDGDLLTRLINEFNKSVERRKAAEYELHRTALKRQVRADIPGEVS